MGCRRSGVACVCSDECDPSAWSSNEHAPVDVLQTLVSNDCQLAAPTAALPGCLHSCLQLRSFSLLLRQLRLQLPGLGPSSISVTLH